jgi:hypothetical protein
MPAFVTRPMSVELAAQLSEALVLLNKRVGLTALMSGPAVHPSAQLYACSTRFLMSPGALLGLVTHLASITTHDQAHTCNQLVLQELEVLYKNGTITPFDPGKPGHMATDYDRCDQWQEPPAFTTSQHLLWLDTLLAHVFRISASIRCAVVHERRVCQLLVPVIHCAHRWFSSKQPYTVDYQVRYEPWVIASRMAVDWHDAR